MSPPPPLSPHPTRLPPQPPIIWPLPPTTLGMLPAFGIYAFVSMLMTGPSVLLIGMAKIEVVPPFDHPWAVRLKVGFCMHCALTPGIVTPFLTACMAYAGCAQHVGPAASRLTDLTGSWLVAPPPAPIFSTLVGLMGRLGRLGIDAAAYSCM